MANVINKTTMEVLLSVNTPDFPETEWAINTDISLLETIPKKRLKFDTEFNLVLKSPAELVLIDAAELVQIKLDNLSIVNDAGEAYIIRGPGVEFPPGSGKYLSVSQNAQLKWMGLAAVADQWEAMGRTYPIRVRTIDDADYIDVPGAESVRAVFAMMANFISQVLDGSEVVKAAINVATTKEEVVAATEAYLATVPTRQ
jgi:hypothetical protein